MEQNPLPLKTLRDLSTLLVVVAEIAWDGTRRALRRFRPYIEPPSDLEVRSTGGAEYSGVLLIDDNDILAGVVVRTGHRGTQPREPPSSFGRIREPLVTPPGHEPSGRDGYLRGWAEDPRSEEEEDVWWPRTQR